MRDRRATCDPSAGRVPKLRGIRVTRKGDTASQVRDACCRKWTCAGSRLHRDRRRARALRRCRAGDARRAPAPRAVTRASAVASIPSDYLALYQKWGGAYGVPWQLLAAVGSVESRHGRDPARLRSAHARRARPDAVPGRLQQGRASASTRPATRASAAPGASGASPRAIRPTAWTTPTTRSRRQRPRSPATPARQQLWPRALWRYNALHSYRKTVLRRAARFGMRSACGLLEQSEQARLAPPALRRRRDSRPRARERAGSDAQEPARDRCDRVRARRRRRHRARRGRPARRRAAGLDRAAPPDRRHGHQDRPPALRDGDAQGLEPLVRPRGDDQRGRRPAVGPGSAAAAALWDSSRPRPRRSGRTRSARPGRAASNPRWFSGPGEQAEIHVGFDAAGAKKS